MTAATLPAVAPASQFPRPPAAVRLRWAVVDSITMTRRNLLLAVRVPANLVFTIVQPAMFILLFRYVFGGAIPVHIKGGYVNYLVPGIFAQTGAFTSFGTAIALAQELKKGSIDRLRSMPMARSAVLLGRLGADIVRLHDHRHRAPRPRLRGRLPIRERRGARLSSWSWWRLALGLVVCCVSAFTGLSIKDEEAVQAFGFIWVFPLTFVSAAFVPISTMPGWMQAFAKNQPFTIFIETMRTLAVGGPVAMHAWQSAVWLVGLGTLFAALAVRAYRRA
jgi:ABC-2 type transport system permease protein